MVNVHLGHIIKQKVNERNLSIAEFALRIHRSRTTVYDIFQRKSIDVDLLSLRGKFPEALLRIK